MALGPPADADGARRRIVFTDIGRAVAALSVFYSHLDVLWLRRDHQITEGPVLTTVATFITDPLYITTQGPGQVGVPLFFLISGYVLMPIVLRLGAGRFLVNRLLRIYPLMAFVVCLAAALILMGAPGLSTGQPQTVTWTTVLTNIALVNYLIVPQVVLIGVAWTLVIEVISYLFLLLLLPALRLSLPLGFALQLGLTCVALATRSDYGPSWFLFAINLAFLPAIVMGQIIWAMHRGGMNRWIGSVLIAACWAIFVWADRHNGGRLDRSYPLCVMLAFLIFCIGLLAEPGLKQRRIWTALSERTYSLYLLHAVIAFPLLDIFAPRLPLAAAMVLAVGFTFAAVEVVYRLVERPSHLLARAWSRPVPSEAASPRSPE